MIGNGLLRVADHRSYGQGMKLEIRRLADGDERAVFDAGSLFDESPDPAATRRFLAESTHHMFVAYSPAGEPVGFISGVETTHPDKGTEMFLYELSVGESARRQGVGHSLVDALAAFAQERGCYGMWVATEPDNVAARTTYERAGAQSKPAFLMFEWEFRHPSNTE